MKICAGAQEAYGGVQKAFGGKATMMPLFGDGGVTEETKPLR